VNEAYRKIEADPKLKDKVKLIGIGVGNSSFEVEYYKNNYKVPFPLFPDPDFKIHKLVGEVRTPFFIGVKNQKGAAPQVYYSKLGGSQDPEELLKKLLANSGLR
jgi:hypothetical protein